MDFKGTSEQTSRWIWYKASSSPAQSLWGIQPANTTGIYHDMQFRENATGSFWYANAKLNTVSDS